jgi:hypothetical protein
MTHQKISLCMVINQYFSPQIVHRISSIIARVFGG